MAEEVTSSKKGSAFLYFGGVKGISPFCRFFVESISVRRQAQRVHQQPGIDRVPTPVFHGTVIVRFGRNDEDLGSAANFRAGLLILS
jgi:hypothetical protein